MGNIKLKKPLFYNGLFNREGHSMRSVFVKDISNGTDTFHLWQSAGQPDMSYPRAEMTLTFCMLKLTVIWRPCG